MLILRSNEPHVILHIHKRSFTTRTQPKSRQKYIAKNNNNKATQPWITQCRSTLVLPSPRYACPRPVPACQVVTYPSLSCVINSHSMSIHCLNHITPKNRPPLCIQVTCCVLYFPTEGHSSWPFKDSKWALNLSHHFFSGSLNLSLWLFVFWQMHFFKYLSCNKLVISFYCQNTKKLKLYLIFSVFLTFIQNV